MAAASVRLARSLNSDADDRLNTNWVLPAYDFNKPERWPPLDPQSVWDAVESLALITDDQLRTHGVPEPRSFFGEVVLAVAAMRSLNISNVVYVPTTGSCLGILTATQLWGLDSKL